MFLQEHFYESSHRPDAWRMPLCSCRNILPTERREPHCTFMLPDREPGDLPLRFCSAERCKSGRPTAISPLSQTEEVFLQEDCVPAYGRPSECSCRNIGNLFCTRIHLCAQHFSIELKSEADYSASALLLLQFNGTCNRCCQSEGWRRQDYDCHQPGGLVRGR